MAVTYRPLVPGHKERIAAWGDEKTGKTQFCIDFVHALKDVHHYVIEADFNPAWDLMMDHDEAGARVTRKQIWPDEWEPYVPTIREWSKHAGPEDWLYVDSMTPSWPVVRAWYTQTVMGKSTADLLMEHAKLVRAGKKKGGNPLEGDTDWGAINAVYNELYMALSRWPGHVLLTAQWKKLGDRDDAADKAAYSTFGHKPDGQKDLGRWPATSLVLRRKGKAYTITTHGDRKKRGDEARQKLDMAEWDDENTAFKVYLRGVAGWKLTKL
jgi:hypothetical protein